MNSGNGPSAELHKLRGLSWWPRAEPLPPRLGSAGTSRCRAAPGLALTATPLPVNRCLTRRWCRLLRSGEPPPAQGGGAAAGRRLAAPAGLPPDRARPLPTPPVRTVPRSFPC
jgi:hypothetical protein